MPLLGFQKQFAAAVESGAKSQTIRAFRKDGRDPKLGDTLYLYTGLRTKQCRKLGEARCERVRRVVIEEASVKICGGPHICHVRRLTRFATDDGFDSWDAMRDWFQKTHGLPFAGLLIEWGDVRVADPQAPENPTTRHSLPRAATGTPDPSGR